VRHLAAVEHNWTQRCLAGRLEQPRRFDKDEHEDADFGGAVADDRVVAESRAVWEEQMRAADAMLDNLADADLAQWRPLPRGSGEITVRDALVHLIEEYARHLGHADILREQIDGRIACETSVRNALTCRCPAYSHADVRMVRWGHIHDQTASGPGLNTNLTGIWSLTKTARVLDGRVRTPSISCGQFLGGLRLPSSRSLVCQE
jgi:hypothetical protein